MVALALLALLANITGATAHQKAAGHQHVTQLQIDTSFFPKESLEVVASCDIKEIQDGDFTKYVADNITISLISHRLGYSNHVLLHEYKDQGKYQTHSISTTVPLWNGKYIPSDRFILPSARVWKCGNNVYYVICSNSTFSCFLLQNENNNTSRLTQIQPKLSPLLNDMWEQTFSPHDVYWCYYLVYYAKAFGLPRAEVIEHKKFIDTKYLYKIYSSLKYSSDKPPVLASAPTLSCVSFVEIGGNVHGGLRMAQRFLPSDRIIIARTAVCVRRSANRGMLRGGVSVP